MSKNLVDICVNLTDEVFSGIEGSIIDEASQKNVFLHTEVNKK